VSRGTVTHPRLSERLARVVRVSTIEDVRALALSLPRSYEVLVRDRVKFRVGSMVYVAFSRDESLMGFGFPKEERASLVESDPDRFLLPPESDLRYRWVVTRIGLLSDAEMREYVTDAWCMVVPKKVAREHLGT
jgi:hypothetical protein